MNEDEQPTLEQQARSDRWDEIKSRSLRGGVYCSDCHVSFFYGLGDPCPKHATPEERKIAEDKILNMSMAEHPLLKMFKR